MDGPRRTSSSATGGRPRRLPPAPAPALCGFLLLLALVFAASYTVGSAVGPVAPGMHGTGSGGGEGGRGEGDGGMEHGHGGGGR
ncbi:hypothetical protein FM076_31080 [Streptomyces albus subsp. chlorinus]|uniref:hypothetical protein n=1 Tax=Streptomyces albus TaxID=1888 RepID=UPI00156FEAC9|nr:hypothetical protein [Streptomyces albus]NSC25356.1 hypothetical protein [Streptomyces albus subsp. chlorinus]